MTLEEDIRQHFIRNDDKLRYQDLVNCYKERFLNDESFKVAFKQAVNKLAYMQEEDGHKLLVLKPNYKESKKLPDGLKSSVLEALRGDLLADSRSTSDLSLLDIESVWNAASSQTVPQIKVTGSDAGKQSMPNIEPLSDALEVPAIEPDSANVFDPQQNTANMQLDSPPAVVENDEKSCESKESTPDLLPPRQLPKTVRTGNAKMARNELSLSSENCSVASVSLSSEEKTWLCLSSKSDHAAMEKLLSKTQDLAHCQDFTCGYNALHWAAKNGNLSAIKFLVGKCKLDVDRKTHGGYTPLHLAAMHGHYNVMELLIKNFGASQVIRDNGGRKADQYVNNALGSKHANSAAILAHKTASSAPYKTHPFGLSKRINAKSPINNFLHSLYPSKVQYSAATSDHPSMQDDENPVFALPDPVTSKTAIKACSSLPNALNTCVNKQDRFGSFRSSKRSNKADKQKFVGPQLASKCLSLTTESIHYRSGTTKPWEEVAQKHKSTDV